MFYETIKIMFWSIETPVGTARYVPSWQYVYKPQARLDILKEDFNSEDKIKEVCRSLLYPGSFAIRQMVRSSKNQSGYKWIRRAVVTIMETNKVILKDNKFSKQNWWVG